MHLSFLGGFAALLFSNGVAAAACNGPLLIDDFAKYSTHTNSLAAWTSDDGSMAKISADSNTLTITPKADAYFYETFPCQAATTNGYTSLQFTIKAPAGSSFSLELQSQTSCTVTKYTSKYYTVTGLTGSTQTITVPLANFSGANLNAISSIVWYAFSSNTAGWQLGQVQFGCAAGTGSSSAVSAPTSSKSSSSVPISTSSKASTTSSVFGSSSAALSSVSSPIGSSSLRSSTPGSSSSSPLASSSAASSRPSSASLPTNTPSSPSSSRVASSSTSSRPSSSSTLSNSISSKSSSTGASSSVSSRASSSSPSSSGLLSSTLSSVIRISSSSTSSASPAASSCSKNLLVEDFESQSRLTFLYYNAMLQPTSDDSSMHSIVVTNNHATFTPTDTSSYWYTQLGCTNAQNVYGGLSMRIKAPAGTTFTVELGYKKDCGSDEIVNVDVSTTALKWTFDGTEKLYSFKWEQFAGVDSSKINTLLFSSLTKAITVGPISFYCGNTVSEYIVPDSPPVSSSSAVTVPAPAGTAGALVIDQFDKKDSNALGFWHGGDDGLTMTWGTKSLKIVSNDADYAFYSQLGSGCKDMSSYEGSYLHIAYSGSNAFSIALQQHNSQCNDAIAPYPETWDEVEAARYASATDIYVPMSHFKIEKSRAIGLAIKSWYKTTATTLTKIEIVPSIPSGFTIPSKLPSGQLVFACKRPNSFAFCIDDGSPEYAQQVMQIIREENIKVTFFTVGAPLLDPSTNLSNVYKDMLSQGHQIAMHSYTHPKMEGLPDYDAIDWEYNNDISVVGQTFNGLTTPYFRPPFGTEGARMRQRLAVAVGNDNPYIVNWSVDVEDWLWATTSTPEKQLDAFNRDVSKGGNLVVMHYLYPSTVGYLKQFIQIAKASGKQLMRLDQCMMDPNAPPL